MRMRSAGTLAICLWLLGAGADADAQQPAKRAPNNMFAQWSPDGKKIAFTSDRDGDPEIYVMNADGSRPVRLTRVPGRDAHPYFSPDGAQIVFQSPRGSVAAGGAWPDTYIYVMKPDGSQQARITSMPGFSGVPVYSPDGKRIAFQRTADLKNFHWHIFVMNADGAGPQQITDGASSNQVPSWSRDGKRLIFHSDRTGKNQIYSMHPDGAGVRRIAETPHDDTTASWSPDGKFIVFTSDRDGNPEIYRMDADGSGVKRLTQTDAIERGPVWSSDGRRILFVSQRDGNAEIYVMDADGRNPTRLTFPPK